MKMVECFMSDDGALEHKLDRAKAHDLHHALPKASHDANAKVLDWVDCLRIMEHADLILLHLADYRERRDADPGVV